jgi:hypothetical protein
MDEEVRVEIYVERLETERYRATLTFTEYGYGDTPQEAIIHLMQILEDVKFFEDDED